MFGNLQIGPVLPRIVGTVRRRTAWLAGPAGSGALVLAGLLGVLLATVSAVAAGEDGDAGHLPAVSGIPSGTNFAAGLRVPETSWRLRRLELDQEFQARVQGLISWSQEQSLDLPEFELKSLTGSRDVQRQIFFIPSEDSNPSPREGPLGEWDRRVRELKDWQGDRIFDLARQAAEAEAGAAAIQLINEVLYFNRDHAESRRILGHRSRENGWLVYPDRLQIRPATRPHELCPWPARGYSIATSPNFQIESNATEEQTRALAEKLERWHYVWRQAFFSYWGNDKIVSRWIEGKGSYSYPRRKFKVIFFKSRADYLITLASLGPVVEDSTGYYSNAQSCSFFYDAQSEKIQETWRHELTHQLFRESIGSGKNLRIFETEYVWLDEGLATYFESLVDHGDFVTLGGFDARRAQYARIGLFLERFSIPLASLSSLGRLELQQHPQVIKIYSQMAAQMDMLLNDQGGAHEAALIQVISQLYRGRPLKPGRFEELIGSSYSQLDDRYRQYLVVSSDQVERFLTAPLLRTELSLATSPLEDGAFAAIGQCHQLIWLDLSGNILNASRIKQLSNCRKLRQLILTRCRIEAGALRALAQFSELEEIDLTGSSIQDQQLLELQGQTNLQRIFLKSTGVTPAGVVRLKQLLPNLMVQQ
jgi:hypothetical protein